MATKHNWGNISKGGSGQGGDKWFKPKQGSKNRFRPLGDPVVFYRYYVKDAEGKNRSAITDDPDNCPISQKHDYRASKRAGINVIDRADGRLKIFEGPYNVFVDMKAAWDNDEVPPGSKDGGDFTISVDVPGGDVKRTKYRVTCNGPSPITEAEKKMIKETGPNGKLFDLDVEFKSSSPDEIEEKLGLVSPKSVTSNNSFDSDDDDFATSKNSSKKVQASEEDEEMNF